jgi:type IV secretion system protein TrbE
VTRVIDDELRQQFMAEGAHFESDYFLTLTYLLPIEAEERIKGWMFEGRGAYSSSQTTKQVLERFRSRVDMFENGVKRIRTSCAMGLVEKNPVTDSEPPVV